jgi:hypothetical protein
MSSQKFNLKIKHKIKKSNIMVIIIILLIYDHG